MRKEIREDLLSDDGRVHAAIIRRAERFYLYDDEVWNWTVDRLHEGELYIAYGRLLWWDSSQQKGICIITGQIFVW